MRSTMRAAVASDSAPAVVGFGAETPLRARAGADDETLPSIGTTLMTGAVDASSEDGDEGCPDGVAAADSSLEAAGDAAPAASAGAAARESAANAGKPGPVVRTTAIGAETRREKLRWNLFISKPEIACAVERLASVADAGKAQRNLSESAAFSQHEQVSNRARGLLTSCRGGNIRSREIRGRAGARPS
jgi:hypothetical protein